jgi:antagonist of KipI
MFAANLSTMGTALVVKSGLLTTVQDLGRWGYQARGVPVSGPMDVWSHRLANALLGNPPDAATLETTLVGPELEFDDERVVAVTGSEFELMVDGRAAAPNTAFTVPAGSRLRFGRRLRGARSYIAIRGGVDVPLVLGSRATHVSSALGGMHGRPLAEGDRLRLGAPLIGRLPPVDRACPIPLPDGHARVRILPGPQQDRFADDALRVLQAGPYTISERSDRMGYRLDGAPLTHAGSADIISDATPVGAIQVPGSGLPILLLADRQTTGGYPKIATVITADLPVVGQLAPGDAISFAECSRKEAIAALIALERALLAVERPEHA